MSVTISELRKRGEYWYASIWINGKRHIRSTRQNKKTEARKVIEKWRREYADPINFGSKPFITVEDAITLYMTGHVAHSVKDVETYAAILARVEKFYGGQWWHMIRNDTLGEFTNHLRRDLAPATVNKCLTILNACNTYLSKSGKNTSELYISDFKQEARAPLTNYLTYEQEEKLLSASPLHLRQQIIFLLNTGVRHGNMDSLDWSKVDLRNRVIHFMVKSKKQGGKPHTIPINDTLFSLLLELGPKEEGRVFPFQNCKKALRTAFKDAGILREKGQLWHLFRHTFLTRLYQATGDIRLTKDAAGHSDIRMTEKYAHQDFNSLRKGFNLMQNNVVALKISDTKAKQSVEGL